MKSLKKIQGEAMLILAGFMFGWLIFCLTGLAIEDAKKKDKSHSTSTYQIKQHTPNSHKNN